jgi:inorganic triphosphatase YgiF
MAIEHEIKLALPASSAAAAHAVLTELTGRAGQPFVLSNIYFDTPQRALAGAHSALRLRLTPQGWLQTFKSGGSAEAGLHSRHEWEMPVQGPALERDALLRACGDSYATSAATSAATTSTITSAITAAAAAAAVLEAAWPALQPLFQTDFTRTLWHWQAGYEPQSGDAAEIEIALDQGEASALVSGERRSACIHELELELKRGPAKVLQPFAQRLAARIPGLVPDNISKAERGYRLLDTEPGPA